MNTVEIESVTMTLDEGWLRLRPDTYLILEGDARIKVTRAKAKHTCLWIAEERRKTESDDDHHAVAAVCGMALLVVQEREDCSVWDAAQILARTPDAPP